MTSEQIFDIEALERFYWQRRMAELKAELRKHRSAFRAAVPTVAADSKPTLREKRSP